MADSMHSGGGVLAGVAATTSAQQVGVAFGNDVNALLLTNATRQAEIKLTAEQKGEAQAGRREAGRFQEGVCRRVRPGRGGGFDPDKFNEMREKAGEVGRGGQEGG